MTACEGAAWSTFTAELVVVVEPVGQNLQPTNWTAALTMIDAVHTALAGARLALSKTTWTLRQDYEAYGGETVYWCVIATVTASG